MTNSKPLTLSGALTTVLLAPHESKVFEQSIATGQINSAHVTILGDPAAEFEAEVVWITMRSERRFAGAVNPDNRCRFSSGASVTLLNAPFRSVRIILTNTQDKHAAAVIDFETRP